MGAYLIPSSLILHFQPHPSASVLFKTWHSPSVWRAAPGDVSMAPCRKQPGGGSGRWRIRTRRCVLCLRWVCVRPCKRCPCLVSVWGRLCSTEDSARNKVGPLKASDWTKGNRHILCSTGTGRNSEWGTLWSGRVRENVGSNLPLLAVWSSPSYLVSVEWESLWYLPH